VKGTGGLVSMIKVSDYIARRVAELGVTHVFMVTGGGAMHLDDSFGRRDDITLVFNHHEQACAIGVEGYARVRGDIGVAVVTTGPGGTNTLTGVLGQWHDSVTALYISGQVRYDTTVASTGLPLRQLGDQEADIVAIVSPITKYAVMVTDPLSVRYHFEKAVHLARCGRPGPVWLDVPLNVQGALVDEDALTGFEPDPAPLFDEALARTQVAELVERLKTAERPVLLGGSGVRTAGAVEAFLHLADRLAIPAVTAWNAHDLMCEEHPLYAGRPSTVGDRAGNYAVQNSDLLISVGCRLNVRQIGYEFAAFAREAYKVVVDIDPVELRKPTIHPDLPVHADAGFFMRALTGALEGATLPDRSGWLTWCLERKRRYPVVLPEYAADDTRGVNPYVFVDRISEHVEAGDIVVTANGAACVVGFQALRLKPGMRLIGNSGTASMGYDLPASIGACVAADRRVICLAGDGSIQMNLHELETIAFRNLPVKVFVFDNGGYLSIRQTQDNMFGGHYVGEGPRSGVGFPDMVRIAEAYGIDSERVSTHAELDVVIARALAADGPALVVVAMDPEQNFAPKVASERRPDGRIVSRPLEDMWPFLDRDEFASNMLVPEWEPTR
jgi:acetolactate synthase-1/2/3 large subunit